MHLRFQAKYVAAPPHTLPSLIYVDDGITDGEIGRIRPFRMESRLPSATYIHLPNRAEQSGAVIYRGAELVPYS